MIKVNPLLIATFELGCHGHDAKFLYTIHVLERLYLLAGLEAKKNIPTSVFNLIHTFQPLTAQEMSHSSERL